MTMTQYNYARLAKRDGMKVEKMFEKRSHSKRTIVRLWNKWRFHSRMSYYMRGNHLGEIVNNPTIIGDAHVITCDKIDELVGYRFW